MKTWKAYQIILFTALCVLLNYGGRMAAVALEMPLWMDSFGTVLCAYIGGPVCAALVGMTGNMIYTAVSRLSIV